MNITVENIKCGGCAGTITKKLTKVFDTENIEINIDRALLILILTNLKGRS